MKKKTAVALITAICIGNGLTAFAAPETMPDGTVFDAEYYAQTNPDVAASLGTDKNVLLQHYITFGINEGRLPYAPGTEQAAANVENTAVVTNTVTGTTPTEILVFLDCVGCRYPAFMLTCSRPIKAAAWRFGSDDKLWPFGTDIYSYDSTGNIISIDGTVSIGGTYAYDAQGRMIHCNSGLDFDFNYDKQGRINSIVTQNGFENHNLKYNDQGLLISMDSSIEKFRYGYDAQGKLTWKTMSSKYSDIRWDYSYDEYGRLTKRTENYHDNSTNEVKENLYSYDAQGRMICEIVIYNGHPSRQIDYIYE